MRKRNFILFLLFLLSCHKEDETPMDYKIHINDFKMDHIVKNEKKWNLQCKKSIISEKENTITCYDVIINILASGKITTFLKSFKGFGDMNKEIFYLENDVVVNSFKEKITVYTSKLYFDTKKEIIYSTTNTRIIKEKEGVEINSIGFQAKTNLSNIKIFKHTTRKLTNPTQN